VADQPPAAVPSAVAAERVHPAAAAVVALAVAAEAVAAEAAEAVTTDNRN
jgi:hypothetical protein